METLVIANAIVKSKCNCAVNTQSSQDVKIAKGSRNKRTIISKQKKKTKPFSPKQQQETKKGRKKNVIWHYWH